MPGQWKVSVTVCTSVAPATAVAACAGSATSTTRRRWPRFWISRDQHHDRVGGHHPGPSSLRRRRGGQDVDDVAGPDEVQQPRRRPGAGARCGRRVRRCELGQSRPQHPDVGEHLTAPRRTGERRPTRLCRSVTGRRREPWRPSGFRAATSSAVRSMPGDQVARGDDDVACGSPCGIGSQRRDRGEEPRALRPPRAGRHRCASSPAAAHAMSTAQRDGLSDSPMPPR